MGLNARHSYLSGHIKTASSQQTEVVSPEATGDLTRTTQTPTIEELSLSLSAVTQKVTVIEGRMSVLESSFEILIQKTAELMEELRLTHEQLATRTQDLISLRMERSRTTECKDVDVKEEVECLRMDIGER